MEIYKYALLIVLAGGSLGNLLYLMTTKVYPRRPIYTTRTDTLNLILNTALLIGTIIYLF